MTSSGIEPAIFRLVAAPTVYIFRVPLSSRPRSWSALTKFFKLIEFFKVLKMILHTYLHMKMEQSIPKRRHIKFRGRGISQKKAYNTMPEVYIKEFKQVGQGPSAVNCLNHEGLASQTGTQLCPSGDKAV